MTATGTRRADCPPWCASDHTGTDETSRPLPHFGAPAYAGPASPVMVYPALLGGTDRPEVVIDLVQRPGEQPDPERPVTWVRLDPGQAANLADIMGAAGQDALAAIIRQAAASIATAPGSSAARDG